MVDEQLSPSFPWMQVDGNPIHLPHLISRDPGDRIARDDRPRHVERGHRPQRALHDSTTTVPFMLGWISQRKKYSPLGGAVNS